MLIGSISVFKTQIDKDGNELLETRKHDKEENNTLFQVVTGSAHSVIPNVGVLNNSKIGIRNTDISHFDSKTYSGLLGVEDSWVGQVQAGMVSPTLELDSENRPVVIIHNRFPPLSTSRSFSYIFLLNDYSSTSRYIRSFVRLQTPCDQSPTEILDIYYRIRVDEIYNGTITPSIQYLISLFRDSLNLSRFPLRYAEQDTTTREGQGIGNSHSVYPFKHSDSNMNYWNGILTTPYLRDTVKKFRNFNLNLGTITNNVDLAQADQIGRLFKTFYPTSSEILSSGYGSKPQVLNNGNDPVQSVFTNSASTNTPFLGSLGETSLRLAVDGSEFDKDDFNNTFVLKFTSSGRLNGSAKYQLSTLKNLGFNSNVFGGANIHCPLIPFHFSMRYVENGRTYYKPVNKNGKWHGYQDGRTLPFECITEIGDNKHFAVYKPKGNGITVINIFNGTFRDFDSDNGLNVTSISVVEKFDGYFLVGCTNTGLWKVDIRNNTVTQLQSQGVSHITCSQNERYALLFTNKQIIFYNADHTVFSELVNPLLDSNYIYHYGELTPIIAAFDYQEVDIVSAENTYTAWCTELGLNPTTSLAGISNTESYAASNGTIPFNGFLGSSVNVRFQHSTQGIIHFYKDQSSSLPTGSTTNSSITFDNGAVLPYTHWNTTMAGKLAISMGNNLGHPSYCRNSKFNSTATDAVFFFEVYDTWGLGSNMRVAMRINKDGKMRIVATAISGSYNHLQFFTSDQNTNRTYIAADGLPPIFVPSGRTVILDNYSKPAEVKPSVTGNQFFINGHRANYTSYLQTISLCPRDKNKFMFIDKLSSALNVAVLLDLSTISNNSIDIYFKPSTLGNLTFTNFYGRNKVVWAKQTSNDDEFIYFSRGTSQSSPIHASICCISWKRKIQRLTSDLTNYITTNFNNGLILEKDSNFDECLVMDPAERSALTFYKCDILSSSSNFNEFTVSNASWQAESTYKSIFTNLGNGLFLCGAWNSYSSWIGIEATPPSNFKTPSHLNNLQWKHYGWNSTTNRWEEGHSGSKECHTNMQNLTEKVKIAFIAPNGVETATAGEYMIFNVYDGILKDNSSTLNYTTTFGVGRFESLGLQSLNSNTIPNFPVSIVNEKLYRSRSRLYNHSNATMGSVNYDDFVNDSWFLNDFVSSGRRWNVVESSTNYKVSYANDSLEADFNLEFEVVYNIDALHGHDWSYHYIMLVPESKPLNSNLFDGTTIYIQLSLSRDSSTFININGSSFNSSSHGFPEILSGHKVRISREGNNIVVRNLTNNTSFTRAINTPPSSPYKVAMVTRYSGSSKVLRNMLISYISQDPLVPIGKPLENSGKFDPDFTGLTRVTEVEVDNIPFEVLHETTNNPNQGQVVVYSNGYLRFNKLDAGKTITRLNSVICKKYY